MQEGDADADAEDFSRLCFWGQCSVPLQEDMVVLEAARLEEDLSEAVDSQAEAAVLAEAALPGDGKPHRTIFIFNKKL